MLHQDLTAAAVGHAIQLAVAPVFLITGIGAMLGVLANRLGRIVDFARTLESLLSASGEKNAAKSIDSLQCFPSAPGLYTRQSA